jgi:glycosyltransferase involved in cell wall biosynthesis
VLIEAMSLGLPPVAFDCPTGPADIIEDGTSGLLVPPRNVAAMARAINGLIEDPDRRARMAAAAREQARQFSASVVGPRWTSLLADLASRPPGQRRSSIALPSLRK